MKKLLALLTSITMLISVMPVMANAEGETTVPSAYTELAVDQISYVSNDYTVKESERSISFETWGTKKGFTVSVDFGTSAPKGLIVKTGWSTPLGYTMDGNLYAAIGDTVIAQYAPYDTGSFTTFLPRYYEITNPEVCAGVQNVTFYSTRPFGKFHSFQFYTEEDVTNGVTLGSSAYGYALKELHTSHLALDYKGKKNYNVDFGENTKELAVKLTRTFTTDSTACAATLKLGDTVLAKIPEVSATASTPLVQTIKLLDSSVCTGEQVITLIEDGVAANAYSLTFVEIVNPYNNMLANGEVIDSGAAKPWKTFDDVMFGTNGTKSIDVTYTGEGTLYIYKGDDNDALFETELPQATDSTITLKFDDPSVLAGFIDTFDIEFSGSVTVSQVKFNENLLNDQFNGATSVSVHYIGEGSDWYTDIKTEFEEANAQDGRTFETDVIDMSDLFSTDFDKLNYVKSYTTTANIVFVQAGDYAKAILDNLVDIDNPPIVMVVGEAAYAQSYCISAISAGENALKDEANYKVPSEFVSSVYSEGLDLANPAKKTGSTFNWNASQNKLGALHPWPSYAKYENVILSHGVSSIAIKHYGGTSDAVVDIRLDSQTGPVLATFTQSSGLTTSVQTVSKSYTGTHDVYVCVRLADNSTTSSWSMGFGDICSIVFNPAIDDTAYTTGLDLANPNNKTLYTHSYNANSGKLGALHPWPSYSAYKSVNLYKGVSKILLKSDYLPTNDQYFEGKKGTRAVIRVGDPITGDVLATFDQIIGWVDSSKLTREAVVTGNYQGNQDIYLCIENDDPNYGKDGYYFAGYSDIYSVVFVPGNVTPEPIDYADGLIASNADIGALTEINDALFLSNGDSVTYSSVVFGEEQIKVLKSNLAATEGTLTVTSGETVVATIDLTGKSGNFENVMAVSDVALTGTIPFTLTYTGTNGCYLKSVEFVNLNAYSTTLDITNYAEVDPGVRNEENASGWDRLPVTVDTNIGKFKSMIDNYIKWEGIDFGTEAKRATVEIGYGNVAQYSGATISVYVDSVSPENKIAETIAEAHHYSWDHRVSNTELVNRYITGYHDIYLVVNTNYESGYAMDRNSSADIFDLKFAEYTTEEVYDIKVEEVAKASTNGSKWVAKAPYSKELTVSFVKDETSPADYMLIAAMYDMTTGQLLKTETVEETTVEGLNVATVRMSYRDFGNGSYLFKYFLWNGSTLEPLANGEDTITVEDIQYPA